MVELHSAGSRSGTPRHSVDATAEALTNPLSGSDRVTRAVVEELLNDSSPRTRKGSIAEFIDENVKAETSLEDSIHELKCMEKKENYEGVIAGLHKLVSQDRAVLEHPWVKQWMGRRWRNIFIREACTDGYALSGCRPRGYGQIAAVVAGVALYLWFHYGAQSGTLASFAFYVALFAVSYYAKRDLNYEEERPPARAIAETYLRMDGPNEWIYVTGEKGVKAMPAPVVPEKMDMGVLFAPGLINGWLPVREFVTAMPMIEKRFPAVKVMRADVHPMRSCEENVEDIRNAVKRGIGRDPHSNLTKGGYPFPEKFIAIGFSKGAPDILTACVEDPEIRKRCKALYTWAGCIGGSYMADEAYETKFKEFNSDVFKRIDSWLTKVDKSVNLRRGPLYRLTEINVDEGVESITTAYREAYNEKHLADYKRFDFPIFNMTGSTEHETLPWFNEGGCVLLSRWDGNNDMQVTQEESKMSYLPRAAHLVMFHANHWDMSFPTFPWWGTLGSRYLVHKFPKDAAMAAMVLMALELGLMEE